MEQIHLTLDQMNTINLQDSCDEEVHYNHNLIEDEIQKQTEKQNIKFSRSFYNEEEIVIN